MSPNTFPSWQVWAVLSAAFAALFGVVFPGERPSLNGWLGIALIATGAVLIAFKR